MVNVKSLKIIFIYLAGYFYSKEDLKLLLKIKFDGIIKHVKLVIFVKSIKYS